MLQLQVGFPGSIQRLLRLLRYSAAQAPGSPEAMQRTMANLPSELGACLIPSILNSKGHYVKREIVSRDYPW
jgi:hypothetical protein